VFQQQSAEMRLRLGGQSDYYYYYYHYYTEKVVERISKYELERAKSSEVAKN